MREFRLKYIIKDKIDYTNEVISNKPGVGIRKIKFLLNTFEFQQRRISRLTSMRFRRTVAAHTSKQARLVSNLFPIVSRLKLPILKHYKSKVVGGPSQQVARPQVLSEKKRIATLLDICRTRNLFFKLTFLHRALFDLVRLPVLLNYCTIFFGTAAFFPLEL